MQSSHTFADNDFWHSLIAEMISRNAGKRKGAEDFDSSGYVIQAYGRC